MTRSPARGLGRVAVAGAAAAGTLVAVLFAAGALDTPDPSAALSSASGSLGEWTYLAVPALAFLETGAFVGLLVPGETAVVVGGVVAQRGDVTLPALIALVWLGAVGGDLVSFGLGRRLGRPFLDAHAARLRIRPEHVQRVERFFARYGGRAVLVGRFVGILRALTPFVAGASQLPLRRFLPYSLLGALTWAATFTVVGYVFASSFESAGEAAARIALGAAVLAAIALLVVARLRGTRRRPRGHEPLRDEGRQDPETRSDQRPGEDIERIVHTQIHPRESNRGSQTERPEAQFGAHERDHGRGPEGGGRVAGGERRVAGNRREGSEVGVGDRRTRAVEELLEPVGGERGAEHRHGRGRGGDRRTTYSEVRAETHADEQRPLDPPGGQHDEDRGQHRVLEQRRGLDQRLVEVERRHRRGTFHRSKRPALLVLVNGRASGIEDAERTGEELVAVLRELGVSATAAVTHSELALWEGLRAGAESGRGRALAGAMLRYKPYRIDARVDGAALGSSSAAQLFLSNLRYFGFGFDVDPGADPTDGLLEAILIEAPHRRALVRRLGATYRGRHLGRPGVRNVSGRLAELTEPLPLVADAIPLGTTTATVSVEPTRLRVASLRPGGAA